MKFISNLFWSKSEYFLGLFVSTKLRNLINLKFNAHFVLNDRKIECCVVPSSR